MKSVLLSKLPADGLSIYCIISILYEKDAFYNKIVIASLEKKWNRKRDFVSKKINYSYKLAANVEKCLSNGGFRALFYLLK